MQSGQLTLTDNLAAEESALLDLPVELHQLILEELKANPLDIINFYIVCLSKHHQWMEKKARPYFFHALNQLTPAQLLEVRKQFNFTKPSDKEAVAYHHLRRLAQQSNILDPAVKPRDDGSKRDDGFFLFICYAFFTDDIRSLGIERVKKALAWVREKHPTYVNAIDNLKGILTALVYERDHDIINKPGLIELWLPKDINRNDIYPITGSLNVCVPTFPPFIWFSTQRGSYHNLASAYLANAHISGNMMYFKKTCLHNCYLPSISAENNYYFLDTKFSNTLIVKRTARGNELQHLNGVAAALPLDRHFGLVIDLNTWSYSFKYLLLDTLLKLEDFVLDFSLSSTPCINIEKSLDIFADLQSGYSDDDVNDLQTKCVKEVLKVLQKLVNDGKTEEAESSFHTAINHRCFNRRYRSQLFQGLFSALSERESVHKNTLLEGFWKMKQEAEENKSYDHRSGFSG